MKPVDLKSHFQLFEHCKTQQKVTKVQFTQLSLRKCLDVILNIQLRKSHKSWNVSPTENATPRQIESASRDESEIVLIPPKTPPYSYFDQQCNALKWTTL